jgi:hypothetical protein
VLNKAIEPFPNLARFPTASREIMALMAEKASGAEAASDRAQ